MKVRGRKGIRLNIIVNIHLAHDVAERPELHGHGDDQERYADQETLVGDGQVNNVHVGDRLHLGESDHHVYD